MSCLHYQSTDPSKGRNYYDVPYNHYLSSSYSPRIQTTDTYRSGDSLYPDIRTQVGRTAYKPETSIHGDQMIIEKMQTKMKFLENSNILMQTRNQNLITENKALVTRLKEEQDGMRNLEKRITSLQEELESEKLKLKEVKEEAEQASRKNASSLESHGTSTTNIVPKFDRGVQIWAVCMGCQRKLEGCEKQPSTVTITKSELEVLENDMQTLRDTIIAREEAWDKAMEREQNYRQQLTRLTTETITARHLSETRYEEEKESELKSLQKENIHLNKLVTKLYSCYHRGQEGCNKSNATIEMNEKDQRFIEELVRRAPNAKSKQKTKSKSACSERTVHSVVHQLATNLRERSTRSTKDQQSSLRESKR